LSPRPDIIHCEMCGRPMRKRDSKVVYIEGARLVLCPQCYSRVAKRAVKEEVKNTSTAKGTSKRANITKPHTPTRRPARRKPKLENYEVVEDYAKRVREARERLGWTQRTLAEAVKESENVIKRIESGRLTPTIELAMRLEKVLGIKLLEPIVDSDFAGALSGGIGNPSKELTLGDIVSIRRRGSKE